MHIHNYKFKPRLQDKELVQAILKKLGARFASEDR